MIVAMDCGGIALATAEAERLRKALDAVSRLSPGCLIAAGKRLSPAARDEVVAQVQSRCPGTQVILVPCDATIIPALPRSPRVRLILVGEAPSRGQDGSRPLEGRCGGFLADLMGASFEEYLELTERANVLDRWPGPAGKGSLFPTAEAREGARRLLPRLAGADVAFLGRRVARAFGAGSLPWLAWHSFLGEGAGRIAVIPHPSGINRFWNDGRNRARARRFFRAEAKLIRASRDGGP